MEGDKKVYTLYLRAEYPQNPSRLLAFLGAFMFIKAILLIPHIFILNFLGILQFAAICVGYWAVLITGRYPLGLFNFTVGVQRWALRTTAWMNGWTDSYPPFSLE